MSRFGRNQSNKESKTHAKLMRNIKETKREMRDNSRKRKK